MRYFRRGRRGLATETQTRWTAENKREETIRTKRSAAEVEPATRERSTRRTMTAPWHFRIRKSISQPPMGWTSEEPSNFQPMLSLSAAASSIYYPHRGSRETYGETSIPPSQPFALEWRGNHSLGRPRGADPEAPPPPRRRRRPPGAVAVAPANHFPPP